MDREPRTEWTDARLNDTIGGLRKAVDEQRETSTREHREALTMLTALGTDLAKLVTSVAVLTERTEAARKAASEAAALAQSAAGDAANAAETAAGRKMTPLGVIVSTMPITLALIAIIGALLAGGQP